MKLLKHEKKYWSNFKTHDKKKCKGENCVVHNPSTHHMRTWPLNYRPQAGITERICKHGIGHPDPDDPNAEAWVHGCCGCCKPPF